MPLPFVPLTLNSEHKIRGEREWQGGGGKKNGPRHKVVFDLHLQHLALHHLPSLSTSTHQHRQQQQQEKRQRSPDSSIGSPSTEIPTLPEALLWQGSETRGALKFRLRLRSPPSICLLLDDSHHEIVIPLSNITSLQLLDAPNAVNGEEEGQNEQAKQGNKEEGFENMERRLRLGGMVLEMGVVKGCQKEFRLREPNRYVRLSGLPGSVRVAAGDGTVEEGDFTGGAAKFTNLIRMTIHSTVTRELTTAMTSLVVRALKVRDGQAVDLSVFGGHLTHLEQMGGSLPSSGLSPMDLNPSGADSDGNSSEGRRDPVVQFVKKGGVGLPRYKVAEEEREREEETSTSKRKNVVEEKQHQKREQSSQINVEEETNSTVEMVFQVVVEKEEPRSTPSPPLPKRPSPPTEPRQTAVTQPSPPTQTPLTLLQRQTIRENTIHIDPPRPPPSKQPVASLGSPALSHAEYTNAHTRLATTPLSVFDARFLSSQSNTSSSPPSTSSLPSTQKHSRSSSIATLVLPPSPTPSSASTYPRSPLSSSSAHQQHQLEQQRTRTVSLGAVGDSRPPQRFPHASSSRTRSVTDGSLLASAVARASAKALEKGISSSSSSSPASPSDGDGFGTRGVVGARTPTSSTSAFPPLDRIFSQGSFAYQYPSPMSTPSSTCLSLSEESDQFELDAGRIRTSSFVSSSSAAEERVSWYGGERGSGSALGFGRPLGGRGIFEGSSIWEEKGREDASGSGGWGGGVTRFASSPFFSISTNASNEEEKELYPTPTPTYATYPSSSTERRRSSLPPVNETRTATRTSFSPLPSTPSSPLPQQHLPSFLRGSTPDFFVPSPPPNSSSSNSNNDAYGRARSISTSSFPPSSSSVSQQRATTPRPTQPKSQPLPPPPSSLLPSSMRDKPVLPFYQLIDPRAGGSAPNSTASAGRGRWVSSSS